jgi:hypothetical protein
MNGADRSGEAFKSVGVLGLAFPNGEDSPAAGLERLPVALVAGAVGCDFGGPVGGIGFDLAAAVDAARAPVPETAMDKDAGPAGGENEIRSPGEAARVQAVAKAGRVKIAAHRELGGRIFAPDRRHDLAAAGWRYRVHEAAGRGCGGDRQGREAEGQGFHRWAAVAARY